MNIVAVTSCITGIAHTYMAAEALEQAAKKAGYTIAVETQGSAGSTPLSAETIANADVVIFAADLEVKDKGRFAGKPLVKVPVQTALNQAEEVIAKAVAAAKSGAGADSLAASGPALTTKLQDGAGVGTRIRLWLMTGVSYMIPFVAAGGLLIALGFMLGGYDVFKHYDVNGTANITQLAGSFNIGDPHWWGAIMFWTGKAAFAFLVPVLAGFIAFAIADRPGIAPGFVGGAIAVTVGAGFLGGLIAAFIAGGLAYWMGRWKVPNWLKPMMPVVVIPLLSSFIVGFAMFIVLGAPLKALMDGLTNWLNGLSTGSMALLGIVLGLMMAFDMGGPVNKVAYVFATTGLAAVSAETAHAPQLVVMAIVMAAGMTPPLGLALATVLAKNKFSYAERQNGKAAWVLGASFITEGAIPFAAADPIRVIPSIMIGSGVTGALVGLFGNELRAPHGGIWVFGLVSSWPTYLLAVLIGTVVTAFLVIVAKGIKANPITSDEALEEAVV